jgi:UDP-N-acetylmuramate dehydrogenase
MKEQYNVDIQRLTSFKLNGTVPHVIVIETEDDLAQLPENIYVLGAGSNTLMSPDIDKPIVRISPTCFKFKLEDNVLLCSAGASVAMILKHMCLEGVSGLEFAAGVPATIGGMVYMNFECWGHEISKIIDSVYIFNKEKGAHWVTGEDIEYKYRWTSFHSMECIILAVKLRVFKKKPDAIKQDIEENIRYRKKKQPLLQSTFGSVFKNPLPKKSGQLIDSSGLKGHVVGGVKVSQHHANFFENYDNGSFQDAIELIKVVQNKVYSLYNIKLECEVQIIQ